MHALDNTNILVWQQKAIKCITNMGGKAKEKRLMHGLIKTKKKPLDPNFPNRIILGGVTVNCHSGSSHRIKSNK